jgi:hypothetical protein
MRHAVWGSRLAGVLLAGAVAAPGAAAQRVTAGPPPSADGAGFGTAARPGAPAGGGPGRRLVPVAVAPAPRPRDPHWQDGGLRHGFLAFPLWYLPYGDGWTYGVPAAPPAPAPPPRPSAATLVVAGPGAPEITLVERRVGRSKVIEVTRDSGRTRGDGPRARGRP